MVVDGGGRGLGQGPPYLTTTQCLGLRGCSSTQLFFTSQVENQPPTLKLRLPSALSRTPNREGPRMVAIPVGEGDWGKLLLHRLSAIQGLGHGSLPRSQSRSPVAMDRLLLIA